MKNKKKILITGATSGVGKRCVEIFIDKGYEVYAIGRNFDNLNYDGVKKLKCDISDYESVKNLFKDINEIDILVNNASVFKTKKFTEFNSTEIDELIDINLKGTMYVTLECLKHMKSGSRIINIGSVSGINGIKNQSVYSSSKHGLVGFSESLSQELEKDGILVSIINPGGIDTPLWNEKNKYDGNKEDMLQTTDIVNIIEYICNLPNNVVLKNITVFPKCEWH